MAETGARPATARSRPVGWAGREGGLVSQPTPTRARRERERPICLLRTTVFSATNPAERLLRLRLPLPSLAIERWRVRAGAAAYGYGRVGWWVAWWATGAPLSRSVWATGLGIMVCRARAHERGRQLAMASCSPAWVLSWRCLREQEVWAAGPRERANHRRSPRFMASLCRLFNLIGSRQPAVALAPVAVGRGELLEFLICDEVLRQLAPPTLIGVYSTSHSVVFFFLTIN